MAAVKDWPPALGLIVVMLIIFVIAWLRGRRGHGG